MTPDQRRALAYHEAAHYVVRLAYDEEYSPNVITVRASGDALGHVDSNEDLILDHHLTDNEIEQRIVFLYAGRAAHLRLFPEDEELASGWAADDDERAAEYMDRLSEDPPEGYEDHLRGKADGVVEEKWDIIEAVAEEVLRYDTIEGSHAKARVDSVLAGGDDSGLAQWRAYRRGDSNSSTTLPEGPMYSPPPREG